MYVNKWAYQASHICKAEGDTIAAKTWTFVDNQEVRTKSKNVSEHFSLIERRIGGNHTGSRRTILSCSPSRSPALCSERSVEFHSLFLHRMTLIHFSTFARPRHKTLASMFFQLILTHNQKGIFSEAAELPALCPVSPALQRRADEVSLPWTARYPCRSWTRASSSRSHLTKTEKWN